MVMDIISEGPKCPAVQGELHMSELQLEKYKTQAQTAILEAFASVQHPGDNNIAADNPNYLEARSIMNALKGQDWRSIPFEVLWQLQDSLPLLTDSALHFFLPAFLLVTLNYESADMLGELTLSFILGIGFNGGPEALAFQQRFKYFSSAQRAAVCLWLQTMNLLTDRLNDDEIHHAMDVFWC